MKRVYGLLVLLLGGSASLQAQDDPFGNVDTHKYQGNMTITAQVIQNGSELTDAVVAVYCDGELREKGSVGNGTNPKRVYLTVHGEYTGHDDYLYFKVYTGGKTFTYDPDPAITFTFNGSIGTDSNPYTIDITPVGLADNADNNNVLTTWAGKTCDVALTDRTLYKDGNWNTICLPFDVSIGGSSLDGDGVVVMELNGAASNLNSEGLLTISFTEMTSGTLTAGKPYIIKWNNTGENIVNPVFTGVTVSNTEPLAVTFSNYFGDDGQFVGSYSPLAITDGNIDEIVYLGADNMLGYASSTARTLHSCRAHFVVPTASTGGARGMKQSIVNFGDGESTGIRIITDTTPDPSPTRVGNGCAWHALDGRRLSDKPTAKGVYISKGKKVIIK